MGLSGRRLFFALPCALPFRPISAEQACKGVFWKPPKMFILKLSARDFFLHFLWQSLAGRHRPRSFLKVIFAHPSKMFILQLSVWELFFALLCALPFRLISAEQACKGVFWKPPKMFILKFSARYFFLHFLWQSLAGRHRPRSFVNIIFADPSKMFIFQVSGQQDYTATMRRRYGDGTVKIRAAYGGGCLFPSDGRKEQPMKPKCVFKKFFRLPAAE